ncbi:ADP-ribosylation factor 6 [Pavlovales sp. CCMP2436]|nr:ADP-ribosylation factor 6 [Pavlovales sp. CCMP2436]
MGGIASVFRRRVPIKVLFAGLDSAGKTTIMHKLKLGVEKADVMVSTMPTLSFNAEVVDYKRARLGLWDVGGQDNLRVFWRHHYTGTQAVVYVVDSNDVERISKSAEELHAMMADRELRFACLLVLANKSDLPYALNDKEVARRMRLSELQGVDWKVMRTCARTGTGLGPALEWIHEHAKPL